MMLASENDRVANTRSTTTASSDVFVVVVAAAVGVLQMHSNFN